MLKFQSQLRHETKDKFKVFYLSLKLFHNPLNHPKNQIEVHS